MRARNLLECKRQVRIPECGRINTAGFEPIGYLGLYPTGTFVGRSAHAAALIRKNNAYFIVNNKSMFDSGIADTKPNDKKEDAIKEMKSQAIMPDSDRAHDISMTYEFSTLSCRVRHR